MADISEININNIPYNIKDAQSREEIETLSTNLENYLPLSGGTLTGSLTTSLQCIVKDNTLDTTVTPASSIWSRHFTIKDTDDVDRGYFEVYNKSDGVQGIQLETKRIVNNENVYNGIRLGINQEGNRTIEFGGADTQAWRNALGASDGVWPIELGGTGATSVTGSSCAAKKIFPTNLGSNIEYLTGMTQGWASTGYVKLPLAIALGGTGQTEITTATGSRNTDNTSAGTINIYKWGKIVTIHSHSTITLSTAIASHKYLAIGTIGSSYRPPVVIVGYAGNAGYPGQVVINTAGTITFYNTGDSSIPSDTKIHFCVTYILA